MQIEEGARERASICTKEHRVQESQDSVQILLHLLKQTLDQFSHHQKRGTRGEVRGGDNNKKPRTQIFRHSLKTFLDLLHKDAKM